MEEDQESTASLVYFDSKSDIKQIGTFEGAFIVKFAGDILDIIFTDNLVIEERVFKTKGLHIWFHDGKGHAMEQEFSMEDQYGAFDYIVRIPPDIVKMYDEERFSMSFPNIIRLIHTSCLFADHPNNPVNHLNFMQGEILHRPIAIKQNLGVIIADRLVVNMPNGVIFYSTISAQRNESGEIMVDFDPIASVELSDIKYIVLLGAENF